MVKSGDILFDKGAPTCPQGEVMSLGGAQESAWSFVRNNANNAWYVNTNGNVNNNNVNNRYVGAAVSELTSNIDEMLAAEAACYKNKHDSIVAARIHYHRGEVNRLGNELLEGTWTQGISTVFACFYPTIREIWAAYYTDRIMHHKIMPVLIDAAERKHRENNDVSHGNRIGHSADTACTQILDNMRKWPNGYVSTRDLSGFFMSINRAMACKMVEDLVGSDNAQMPLIRKLILHDPTQNCKVLSSPEEMAMIPHNKSAFYAKEGCAFPLGNFYSQIVANLIMWVVDAVALRGKYYGKIGYTRFVDDMCAVGATTAIINEFWDDVNTELSTLGLRMHPNKKYMQPVRNGVSFCGRTIRLWGIYINNRTVKAAKYAIRYTEDAEDIVRTMNSYGGFMCHLLAWKIQHRLAEQVCTKWPCICYSIKHNQIIYRLKANFSPKVTSKKKIKQFKRNLYETNQGNQRLIRHQGCRGSRSRETADGRLRTGL